MQQTVFEPAGMAATVPNDPRRPPAERTAFYVSGGRGFEPAPAFDPSFKLPGAGFLSTAEDLVRFGMALLEPGLLSEQARREMFTPVALADGTPTRYALGFQALEEDGRRLLLQSGGGPGDLELARDLSRGAAGRRPPRQCHGRASGPDRAPRGPELPHTSRTRATAPAPTGVGAGAVSSGGTLTRSFALRRPSRSWSASK